MEYCMKCQYSQADFDKLVKAQAFRMRPAWAASKRGVLLLKLAAYLLLALAILSLSGMLRMMVAKESAAMIIQLVSALVFGVLGFWALRKSGWSGSGKMAWRAYPFRGRPVFYTFREEGFQVETPTGKGENDWRCILDTYEDATHYYLFDTPRTAHIIPKSSFTQGDPQQFGAFVEAHTNKPVIKIQ